jgi:hypothetical protein
VQLEVTVRATLNDGQILPNPLPDTITFQLLRRSVNATYQQLLWIKSQRTRLQDKIGGTGCQGA